MFCSILCFNCDVLVLLYFNLHLCSFVPCYASLAVFFSILCFSDVVFFYLLFSLCCFVLFCSSAVLFWSVSCFNGLVVL